MSYLLDTNVCIALINDKPTVVRSRLEKVIDSGTAIRVSSISVFELWYGVSKSVRRRANAMRVATLLAGPISVVAFESDDAQSAGSVRADLEAMGKPIGAYDVLIASQALHRKLTLVTANVSEFARVKGLAWQDWARA